MRVGIEAINFYGGPAFIEVKKIFEARGLDMSRFNNLLMEKKSVSLPCEDAVTHAVNAANPIIQQLTDTEKSRIEMVITASESGVDFGKAISTYVHDYLGLGRNCRLFEIKQACYGCTAAFHTACNFVASQASPGAKVLVIATDVPRFNMDMGGYAETSQGVGAIAMLVGEAPHIFELDFGATGYYSYEVMDTCRPLPDIESGDSDLSLLSYLDCLENSYKAYAEKVEGVDFKTFDYMAFHTPFAGAVKGGHRKLMRDLYRWSVKEIEEDFKRRMVPSLHYCVQVGNVYSATLYLALCGLIDFEEVSGSRRIGMYSYGSGCSSEFYSGTINQYSRAALRSMRIGERLEARYKLNIEEYERLLMLNKEWIFGIKDKEADISGYSDIYERCFEGQGLLVLKQIKDYHREYKWS